MAAAAARRASCVTAPAFQLWEAIQKAINELQIIRGFTITAKPKTMPMNWRRLQVQGRTFWNSLGNFYYSWENHHF